VEYIPLSLNRAKIRLASNVDLRMNFLPNWVLSLSARKVNNMINIVCIYIFCEYNEGSEKF
jgi:hypothetical protein